MQPLPPPIGPGQDHRWKQIRNAPDSWYTDGMERTQPAFVDNAHACTVALVEAGMDWPYVYPTYTGGIQLEWNLVSVEAQVREVDLEVEIVSDGPNIKEYRVLAYHFDGDKYHEPPPIQDMQGLIAWLKPYLRGKFRQDVAQPKG